MEREKNGEETERKKGKKRRNEEREKLCISSDLRDMKRGRTGR